VSALALDISPQQYSAPSYWWHTRWLIATSTRQRATPNMVLLSQFKKQCLPLSCISRHQPSSLCSSLTSPQLYSNPALWNDTQNVPAELWHFSPEGSIPCSPSVLATGILTQFSATCMLSPSPSYQDCSHLCLLAGGNP
jgi:hypothetical protein